MAFSANSSNGLSGEINVTPLIDVLLVLLIIFMVIVPVLPRGMDTAQPQPGAPRVQAAAPLVVRVLGDGAGGTASYSVDGERVEPGEVRARLVRGLAVRQDRPVFVQADGGLSFQRVAEVVGEAKAAGAGTVSLARLEGVRARE